MLTSRLKWHSIWSLVMCVGFMIFWLFLSTGCSWQDDTIDSQSNKPLFDADSDGIPDLDCPAGTNRLADASRKTTETCMLINGDGIPDLDCPAGTNRLADASRKTTETCMLINGDGIPDLDCPAGTNRLADASRKTTETCMLINGDGIPDLDCPAGTNRLAGASRRSTETCMLDTDGDGIPDSTDTDDDDDRILDSMDVDDDGDGLIEIDSLEKLHNIRYNLDGTSYKASTRDIGNSAGCGGIGEIEVCKGYELTQDLDFDEDGDGSTWSIDSTNEYILDVDDDASPYFVVDADGNGGWEPIGEATLTSSSAVNCVDNDINTCFNAIFEGNNHKIIGLAIRKGKPFIGMFGAIGANAKIRNSGLINNRADCTKTSDNNYIGGLVGLQAGGSITESYATGSVDGEVGKDNIGGLVGRQAGGSITGSYSTGSVKGGAGSDNVGGFVGFQNGGSIIGSYATGSVKGGAGSDNVGGFVGYKSYGSIIGSHARGSVDGGAEGDNVGGFVGSKFYGSITGSYAKGVVDGGAGSDNVGGLAGYQFRGSITSSYAIGVVNGGAGGDNVGGLVGSQIYGNITGSYAKGAVNGGAGGDNVGGLVGSQIYGNITGSYAIGAVNGGTGNYDRVGGLVGQSNGIITGSYGFGIASGRTINSDGSPPLSISNIGTATERAAKLMLANVGMSWNADSKNTLGAWNFGTDSQVPALKYADYDGTGNKYYCDNVTPPATGTPIPISNCGDFIPGQRE